MICVLGVRQHMGMEKRMILMWRFVPTVSVQRRGLGRSPVTITIVR